MISRALFVLLPLLASLPTAAGCGGGVYHNPLDGPARTTSDGGTPPPAPRLSGEWKACGTLGTGGPLHVTLSADGSVVAFGFREGQVAVHRVADQALLLELPSSLGEPPADLDPPILPPTEAPPALSLTIALSPDGGRVAVTTPSRFAIWRVSDGALLTQVPGLHGRVVFSPDGETLLAGIRDLRSSVDGTLIHRDPLGLETWAAGFGKGGEQILTYAGSTVSAFIADQTGAPVGTTPLAGLAADGLRYPTFSPGGRYLAGIESIPEDSAYQLVVFSTASGDRVLTAPAIFGGPTFSPDETTLLVTGSDPGKRAIVDLRTLVVHDISTPDNLTGTGALGPAGKPLFMTDVTGVYWTAEPLDGPNYRRFPTLAGEGVPFMALSSSPDGRWLATASYPWRPDSPLSQNLILWDLSQRRGKAVLPGLMATSVEFSRDSTRLLTGGFESYATSLQEWPLGSDRSTWKLTNRRSCHGAYSPALDGTSLAVSLTDGVGLARIGDDDVIPSIAVGHVCPAMAFSPRDGGLTLATSGPALWRVSDKKRLWPAEIEPPPTVRPEGFEDRWVTFSPDGSTVLVSDFLATRGPPFYRPPIVMASYSSITRLHRASDGSLLQDLGETSARRPTFSPDGAWIIGGDILWSMESGSATRLPLAPHRGIMMVSTFTSDGTIAVGREDGTVALFCPK